MIEVRESLESPEEEGEGGDTRHGQRWKIPHSVETASCWLGSGGVFEVGEENGHIFQN